MRILALDDQIEIAQAIAHRPGRLGIADIVQDRFVILVHEHHHPLTMTGMGPADEPVEATGAAAVGAGDLKSCLVFG